MEATSSNDMLVAGFVLLTALIAFIAVLYLNRKSAGAKKVKHAEEPVTGGTAFVEEGGRVVRRSTRQHKPTSADDAFTPSPLPKNPRAARADAGATTPVTAARTPRTAERMTSPPRGRRGAAAKSPAGRSPAPAATPASPPATTPRRGRPPKVKAVA